MFFLQKLWLCGHTMSRQPTVIHSWGSLFLPRINCCPLIEQIWLCDGPGNRWWNCSHSIYSRSLSPGRPAVGLCGPVMALSNCSWREIAMSLSSCPKASCKRLGSKDFCLFTCEKYVSFFGSWRFSTKHAILPQSYGSVSKVVEGRTVEVFFHGSRIVSPLKKKKGIQICLG